MGIQSRNATTVEPFLKWAGGKRWLVEKYFGLLDVEFDRFIEPFLGGGAVFFRLAPSSSILCDRNSDLIDTYRAIRDDWKQILRNLKRHHRNHSAEYYYRVRAQNPRSPTSKAAKFIYLNRTCWNGLYRVNLRGEFNVPIGTKKNVILEADNFEEVAKLLQNSELISGDFEMALDKAGSGDFVFVDPPYTVKHNYNGFIKYNEKLFSWEDQIRLRDGVSAAVERGAKVLVTNAHHKCVEELYEGVGEIIKLSRPSVISGSASARGHFDEMVIKCF